MEKANGIKVVAINGAGRPVSPSYTPGIEYRLGERVVVKDAQPGEQCSAGIHYYRVDVKGTPPVIFYLDALPQAVILRVQTRDVMYSDPQGGKCRARAATVLSKPLSVPRALYQIVGPEQPDNWRRHLAREATRVDDAVLLRRLLHSRGWKPPQEFLLDLLDEAIRGHKAPKADAVIRPMLTPESAALLVQTKTKPTRRRHVATRPKPSMEAVNGSYGIEACFHAMNCAYCSKWGKSDCNHDLMLTRCKDEDKVLACPLYYPKKLSRSRSS